MNLKKEYKTLILPILKGLPFLVALLVFTFLVASKLIDYMQPEYQAVATVRIDNREDGLTDFVLFQQESAPSAPTTSGFLTEVEMFKSHVLKKEALKGLNFDVSYYRVGKVKERELFDERPFFIEYEINDEKLWGKKFYLEFWGKERFRLYKDKERKQFVKTIRFDKTYLDSKSLNLTIVPNLSLLDVKSTVLQPGDVFAFKINKLESLSRSINDNNFYVKPVNNDVHVVKLYYNHPVPEKATYFVNALADAYILSDQKNKESTANKTLEFIDQEIANIRTQLASAEKRLSRFRSTQGLIDTKQETDALLKQINSFDFQKLNLDLKEVELENLYDYIVSRQSLSDFSPDFEMINDDVLMHTYLKLKDLELAKTDMKTKYPESSTEVSAITAKIAHLKDFTLESIKKKLLNISEKRAEIGTSIENLHDKFKGYPDKERQLALLQRDFMLKEKTFEYLTEKRTELGIVQSSKLTYHRVVDYADVPIKPISPNKKLLIGVALLLMLLVGMGLVYIFDYFWKRVRTDEEIEEQFGTPLMATVEKSKKKQPNPMEPYLNLYTNLNNINMLSGGKIISICSTSPREGKSTITANFGKLLASFDKQVLLIDMNMETPMLHQFFKMENQAGVDDILERDAHAQSLVRTNGIPNLSLITAGNKSEATSTKVFSPKTASFLQKMRTEYDVVLIDTAAVAKRLDAAAIMRLCDANLFLFRKGKTKVRKLEVAQEFIKDYHIPNVYLVFNKG